MRSFFGIGAFAALALACVSSVAQTIRVGPVLQDAEPASIAVMWETTAAFTGFVDYGPTAALGLTAVSQRVASVNGAVIHHAQLTGLQADTVYYYRVRSGSAQSDLARFRTPPTPASEKSFRFMAYSDMQGNGSHPRKHTEIVNEGMIGFVTQELGPNLHDEVAFVIVPGDLVSQGSVYDQWKDQFFDEAANLTRFVPYYPVPGNHEQDSAWFFRYFQLPRNGTPGFEEHWWYKDYGNLRIIGCDSNTAYRNQQQLDWLDMVLADAAGKEHIDFVFAQMHHPHLSELWTPGNTDYTREIVERLERFSTDTGKPSAHFFGHTHGYERGQSRDHTHLWVNVSAGEGGIDYWGITPPEDYAEIQKSFPDWGFVLIEITAGDNPTLRLRRVSRGNEVEPKDNEVMDDITIRRHNQPPSAPTPIGPAPGVAGLDPLAVELVASPFADSDGQDFHIETHIQLTATPGDWTSPVDVWTRYENWYAPEGASGRDTGYYSVDTVAGADITRAIAPRLAPGTTYEWRVRYRDSGLTWSDWSTPSGFSTGALPTGACCLPEGSCEQLINIDCDDRGGTFRAVGTPCATAACPEVVVLLEENFDALPLGPTIDEVVPNANAWTDKPPPGWIVDDSGVPSVGIPGRGVTEWEGWSFADKDWWSQTASDQGRSRFERARGTAAIADPDEWDDLGNASGLGFFDAKMTTAPVDLSAVDPASVLVSFDSSWLPEGTQHATVTAEFDTGERVVILDWESRSGPNFKAGNTNERVDIPLPVPAGAASVRLTFRLHEAKNNWWWAIDHLLIRGTPISCSQADLVPPFGDLTFADVSAFLGAYADRLPIADLAEPFGEFTFADINAFLRAFADGCA